MSVELGLALLIFLATFTALGCAKRLPSMPIWSGRVLRNVRLQPVLVIVLALLGRGLLMPRLGIPQPHINDEFSYLLLADTFAHHRLTNPTPPSWQHFETFHVNMFPTYHSKYPIAQGVALAFGQVVFHQPWIGVYLSTALLCGAICWALQGFLPAKWALLGGLLAVARIGMLSYWMNSYWGGSMAALGGALALGAVIRLFDPGNSERRRVTLALVFVGALLILATSRPYEGLAFALPLLLFFGTGIRKECRTKWRSLRSSLLPVLALGSCAVVFMIYYNFRTTGSVFLMPYALNERVYSSLPLFVLESPKPGPAYRHADIEKFWMEQKDKYRNLKSASAVISWDFERFVADWWFYVGPALSLPVLLGFLSSVTRGRHRVAVYSIAATWLAVAFSIYSQPHYLAVATVAIYLFALEGLRYMWQSSSRIGRPLVVALCLATVVATLTRNSGTSALYTNFTYGKARQLISHDIAGRPERYVILVTYEPGHISGDDIVHNGADLKSEKILWARSMGPAEDAELCGTYPDRVLWKISTDDVGASVKPLDVCNTAPTAGSARRSLEKMSY